MPKFNKEMESICTACGAALHLVADKDGYARYIAAVLDQDEVEVTTKFHSGEIEEHQHPEVKWVKEITSEMTKAALDEMVKKTKEMKDKIK